MKGWRKTLLDKCVSGKHPDQGSPAGGSSPAWLPPAPMLDFLHLIQVISTKWDRYFWKKRLTEALKDWSYPPPVSAATLTKPSTNRPKTFFSRQPVNLLNKNKSKNKKNTATSIILPSTCKIWLRKCNRCTFDFTHPGSSLHFWFTFYFISTLTFTCSLNSSRPSPFILYSSDNKGISESTLTEM